MSQSGMADKKMEEEFLAKIKEEAKEAVSGSPVL